MAEHANRAIVVEGDGIGYSLVERNANGSDPRVVGYCYGGAVARRIALSCNVFPALLAECEAADKTITDFLLSGRLSKDDETRVREQLKRLTEVIAKARGEGSE